MKNKIVILEAGADGGSIMLIQKSDYYLFTTDETTLREFVPEMMFEDLKSKSDIFSSFAEAMKNLLEKYPIFSLHPLSVHPDFRNKIIPYYQGFCSGNNKNWNKEDWDKLL